MIPSKSKERSFFSSSDSFESKSKIFRKKPGVKSETGFTRLLMLKLIFLAGLGINDHRILHVSSKLILMPSILLAPGIAKKEKM